MILTISLSDALHEKYSAHDPKNPAKAITKQLERFQDVNPDDRAVVLSGEDRQKLEAAAQRTFETSAQLANWAVNQVSLELDGVHYTLSEDQRKRLLSNAKFYQRNHEDEATAYQTFVQNTIKRALDGVL